MLSSYHIFCSVLRQPHLIPPCRLLPSFWSTRWNTHCRSEHIVLIPVQLRVQGAWAKAPLLNTKRPAPDISSHIRSCHILVRGDCPGYVRALIPVEQHSPDRPLTTVPQTSCISLWTTHLVIQSGAIGPRLPNSWHTFHDAPLYQVPTFCTQGCFWAVRRFTVPYVGKSHTCSMPLNFSPQFWLLPTDQSLVGNLVVKIWTLSLFIVFERSSLWSFVITHGKQAGIKLCVAREKLCYLKEGTFHHTVRGSVGGKVSMLREWSWWGHQGQNMGSDEKIGGVEWVRRGRQQKFFGGGGQNEMEMCGLVGTFAVECVGMLCEKETEREKYIHKEKEDFEKKVKTVRRKGVLTQARID